LAATRRPTDPTTGSGTPATLFSSVFSAEPQGLVAFAAAARFLLRLRADFATAAAAKLIVRRKKTVPRTVIIYCGDAVRWILIRCVRPKVVVAADVSHFDFHMFFRSIRSRSIDMRIVLIGTSQIELLTNRLPRKKCDLFSAASATRKKNVKRTWLTQVGFFSPIYSQGLWGGSNGNKQS
jgi:hypothetical protein